MKNNKKIIYFISLIISFVLCSPLIRFHIASDTYNFMYLGYFEYPKVAFLRDARIFSALCSYLAGILKLDYSFFIVLMEILAIIIMSIAIYMLYDTIINKIEEGKEKEKFCIKNFTIYFGSILVIFNCMSIEYLLYAECAVMCLSVLCSVLGARIFTSNQKNKFLKTLLIMIIAILCYQGSINLFITLVTLLLLIEDKSKNNKKIFKEIFLAGIISIIICVFSALIIYINNSILGNQQNRLYLTNGNKLINWINRIIFLTKYVMKTNFQLWPKMFIPIIILITTILLCFTKNAIKNIIKYIFIILIAILACTLPTYCMELAFLEPRTSMSIGAIVGISIIYLATNIRKEKIFSKIVFIIGLILLIFNSINTIKIFYYHIKTNEFDKIMALQIKKEIEKYERSSGKKVTKIAFYFDKYSINHPSFIEHNYSSFTQRALNNRRCITEALSYYCNRHFISKKLDKNIYKNFKKHDWNNYSKEQLIFKGDTLNICSY